MSFKIWLRISLLMFFGMNFITIPAVAGQCGDLFFFAVKDGLESAGGAVAAREDFPLAVKVTPVSGQIEWVRVDATTIRGCAVPGLDFYIKGDELEPGTIRGMASIFESIYAPTIPLADRNSDIFLKMVDSCLKGRPNKYDKSFRREGRRSDTKKFISICMTEATASGIPKTSFHFLPFINE